jgi:hypothetical protein
MGASTTTDTTVLAKEKKSDRFLTRKEIDGFVVGFGLAALILMFGFAFLMQCGLFEINSGHSRDLAWSRALIDAKSEIKEYIRSFEEKAHHSQAVYRVQKPALPWDLNGNGICDHFEDRNGDGVCGYIDI